MRKAKKEFIMEGDAEIKIDMSPLARESDLENMDGMTNPSNMNNENPPDFDEMAGTSMKSTVPPMISVEQFGGNNSKKALHPSMKASIGKLPKAKN